MSDTEHIRDILPGVMVDIRDRMRDRNVQQGRVVQAYADFEHNRKRRTDRTPVQTILTTQEY